MTLPLYIVGYILEDTPMIGRGAGPSAMLLSAFLQFVIRNGRALNTAKTAVISGGAANVILNDIFIFPMNWEWE